MLRGVRFGLGKFTVGYIVSVTAAAVVGILFLKWIAGKWPRVPVVGTVARSI